MFRNQNILTIVFVLTSALVGHHCKSNFMAITKKLSKVNCVKQDWKNVKECIDEYKPMFNKEITEKNNKEVCCSIYGYQKCVECVIKAHCTEDAEKAIHGFESDIHDLLGDKCKSHYSWLHCMDKVGVYIILGVGLLILLIIIGCICCCCCCGKKKDKSNK